MAAVDGKSANGKAAEADEGGFYDDIENLKKLCDFLRSKEGPAVREAVEMDKRVYYLKGELFKEFFSSTGTELVMYCTRTVRFLYSVSFFF